MTSFYLWSLHQPGSSGTIRGVTGARLRTAGDRLVSNRWRRFIQRFSNRWKILGDFFQSLETFWADFPIIGKMTGASFWDTLAHILEALGDTEAAAEAWRTAADLRGE